MSHAIKQLFLVGSLACLPLGAVAQEMTGPTGGGMPHPNMQPSLGVAHIIATEGIFPSRGLTGGAGSGTSPFLGQIRQFAGNFAPRGWEFADGQLIQVEQNPALFSLLGTTYGGNGRTNFALPDLRGRTAIHAGMGTGLSDRPFGQTLGVEEVKLSVPELPSHSHALPSSDDSTGDTGDSQPHTNMQPLTAVNYIVAREGIFPSRSATERAAPPLDAGGGSGGIDPFIGQISLFAGNFAPRGWELANGQLLPVAQNDALFALYGTTYGGDGRTTFALPDLRGRAALQPGNGPGLSSRRLGEKLGIEEVTLNELQLPSHDHSLPQPDATTGDTGGGQPHTNMQPSLALNYIIALEGVFPSRNLTAGGSQEYEEGGAGGGSEPFIGEIRLFGGNFAPRGWAFADGELLPIDQNQALFAIMGNAYGGDGRSNFGLPDLRGRVPIHVGTGPGLSSRRVGETVGTEYVALTQQQIPAHSHTIDSLGADFDKDGDVDGDDFLIWQLNFGVVTGATSNTGDANGDGAVDGDDYLLWQLQFSSAGSQGEATAATAPEPGSLALIVAALVGGLLLRRNRL